MSRYWIPAESQHWPAATPSSASSSGAPPSRTPPAPGTPPKEHDLPPSTSSSSNSTSVSTKLENYESLNHPGAASSASAAEEAAAAAAASNEAKDVKAEDGLKQPLQNYTDYYQQHYPAATASTSPHNDLSSAFINSNSNIRSNPLARPSQASASKSNKNRPNAGKKL